MPPSIHTRPGGKKNTRLPALPKSFVVPAEHPWGAQIIPDYNNHSIPNFRRCPPAAAPVRGRGAAFRGRRGRSQQPLAAASQQQRLPSPLARICNEYAKHRPKRAPSSGRAPAGSRNEIIKWVPPPPPVPCRAGSQRAARTRFAGGQLLLRPPVRSELLGRVECISQGAAAAAAQH
jgi:hypothetical protein